MHLLRNNSSRLIISCLLHKIWASSSNYPKVSILYYLFLDRLSIVGVIVIIISSVIIIIIIIIIIITRNWGKLISKSILTHIRRKLNLKWLLLLWELLLHERLLLWLKRIWRKWKLLRHNLVKCILWLRKMLLKICIAKISRRLLWVLLEHLIALLLHSYCLLLYNIIINLILNLI